MSENILPSTPRSPRFVNGVWRWFNGDCFSLCFHLDLIDTTTQEHITIQPEDKVYIRFVDKRTNNVIYVFNFTNINENKVTCTFTTDVTKLFPAGEYSYSIKYCHGTIATTVGANLGVIVEACR